MKIFKRILAIIGIIVLLGSILAICLMLFNANRFSDTIVRGLVSCLVAIPLVSYGYLILCKYAKNLSNNLRKAEDDDKI